MSTDKIELRKRIRDNLLSEMLRPLVSSPRIDWLDECLKSLNPNNYCIVKYHRNYDIVFSPKFVLDNLRLLDEAPDNNLYYFSNEGFSKQIVEDLAVARAILGVLERREEEEKSKVLDRIKMEEEIRADYRRRW